MAATAAKAMKRPSNEAVPVQKKRARSTAPSGRVNVAVRVRPTNSSELSASRVVQVVDDRCLVFDPREEDQAFYFRGQKQLPCGGLNRANKNINFLFDKVFDETKDNVFIFENTTKEMLDTLLDGCNCSVFAYGATGSGKTYTMLGAEDSPGVVWHTIRELYLRVEKLRSDGQSCEVTVAYLEVYNEKLRDLLRPTAPGERPPPLVVGEDPSRGIVVSNLTLHKVAEADALLELLRKGNLSRTQHATDANAESSRSHAIFQVYVTQTECVSGTLKQMRMSKMSFIDLAGSERSAAVSKNIGARFREGTNINLSLLALGNVIDALANNKLVSYRQSKLTYILKDSLGGTCRTLMIANVSPSSLGFHNTHNTLKYAERAMKIQLQAKKNVLNVRCHMTMYAGLLEDSKKKVDSLTTKLSAAEARGDDLAAQLRAAKEKMARLEEQLAARHGAPPPAEGQAQAVSSTGTPEAPSPVKPKLTGSGQLFVEAVDGMFSMRSSLIRQLCECETGLRANKVKSHWKHQVLRTHALLSGEVYNADDADRTDAFLKTEHARRQQLLGQREDLKNRLRRNFEDIADIVRQAKKAHWWEAVEPEVTRLEGGVALAESTAKVSMFRKLCEEQARRLAHWEAVNEVAVPHLRELYDIFKARNYDSNDLLDTYQEVVRRVKGLSVRWADQQPVREGNELDLHDLLEMPTWHQSASVAPSSDQEDCNGYAGDATVVRFPLGSPHPRRSAAAAVCSPVLKGVDLNVTFEPSPIKPPTLEQTFVRPGEAAGSPHYGFASGASFMPSDRPQKSVAFAQPAVCFPASSRPTLSVFPNENAAPLYGMGRGRGRQTQQSRPSRLRKSISTPNINRALMANAEPGGTLAAYRKAEAEAKAKGSGANCTYPKNFRTPYRS